MFKGFNLPKSLLETSEGLLKQVNEQDRKFNALLEEYGITTPMQLSETKQVEFLNRAEKLLGEDYTGLRKLRDAVNLREGYGVKAGQGTHGDMIQYKNQLSKNIHAKLDDEEASKDRKINEVSNEAPNIQRLTLTQEKKEQLLEKGRKLTEIGSDSAYGLSEDETYSEPAHGDKRHLLKGSKMEEEPVENMKQVKMVHQEEKDDAPFDADKKSVNWKDSKQSRARWLAKHALQKAKENAEKKVEEETLEEGGMKRLASGETMNTYKKKPPEPVKEESLDEREMTPAEMKKREDIVKSMKKGLAGFKERYGKRAKDVMYATATKQAMKEDVDPPKPNWKWHNPDGKHVEFVTHPDATENQARTRIMQIHSGARALGQYNAQLNSAGSPEKVKVSKINEESVKTKVKSMLGKNVPKAKNNEDVVVKGGKTMTGQKMNSVNLEPKMADGVMTGAQVKSGSI